MSNKEVNENLSFSGLILGFSSAALYYMGENAINEKSVESKNLALASQNINIISMLKEKTQGNLTGEEARLLEQVIADLQIRYVKLV